MKKRTVWYVYALLAVLIVYGLYVRNQSVEDLVSIDKEIDNLSKPVEVMPIEKSPELPPPPKPQTVESKSAPGSLVMMKKERESFLARHKLSFNIPNASGTVIKKELNYETLFVSQRYGHYSFWVTVFENADVAKIRKETLKAFGLTADDLKPVQADIKTQFQLLDGFEFENAGTYCLALILKHPKTKDYIVVGFNSKKFNTLMEEISNKLFESLKPL